MSEENGYYGRSTADTLTIMRERQRLMIAKVDAISKAQNAMYWKIVDLDAKIEVLTAEETRRDSAIKRISSTLNLQFIQRAVFLIAGPAFGLALLRGDIEITALLPFLSGLLK
jgi:hypothetical protein